MSIKTYTINGKKYTQRPLVLGQINQLTAAMKGIEIPAGSAIGDVAGILGDHLPYCAAAVLQPKGVAHKDKDLDALAAEFSEHMDLETTEQVIDDFFVVTPATTLAKLFGRMRGMLGMMRMGTMETGSTRSSSSSPVETSPSVTPSSGDTP